MLAGALRIHKSLDRELGIVQSVLGFGALACDRGQFELGARLFGAAEAWRERLGQSVDPFDRIELATDNVERLRRARSALGEIFDRRWTEGRALSPDDALASAATLAPPAEAGPPWLLSRKPFDTGGETCGSMSLVGLTLEAVNQRSAAGPERPSATSRTSDRSR